MSDILAEADKGNEVDGRHVAQLAQLATPRQAEYGKGRKPLVESSLLASIIEVHLAAPVMCAEKSPELK